jgi:hypothetical protein
VHAADVIADQFALAGAPPGADLNAERRDFVDDGTRAAAHVACRTVGDRPVVTGWTEEASDPKIA